MENRLIDITKAADETFKSQGPKGFQSKILALILAELKNAFILGAQWADNNPFQETVFNPLNLEDLNLTDNDS